MTHLECFNVFAWNMGYRNLCVVTEFCLNFCSLLFSEDQGKRYKHNRGKRDRCHRNFNYSCYNCSNHWETFTLSTHYRGCKVARTTSYESAAWTFQVDIGREKKGQTKRSWREEAHWRRESHSQTIYPSKICSKYLTDYMFTKLRDTRSECLYVDETVCFPCFWTSNHFCNTWCLPSRLSSA